MGSFIYLIDRYSKQLELVINKGWKFNTDQSVVPSYTGPKIPHAEILNKILENLKKAPVYYVGKEPLDKFITFIENFKNLAEQSPSEKSKTVSVANKIHTFVLQKGNSSWSCFQGDAAKQVNMILDKRSENMTERDYGILYDLANIFASERKKIQLFYHLAAFREKIKTLRKECPAISIRILPNGQWQPIIRTYLPQNVDDLHAILLFQFHTQNYPLSCDDPQFLKTLVQRKVEAKDVECKNYLKAALLLCVFGSLGKQWEQIYEKQKNFEFSNQEQYGIKTDLAYLNLWIPQFIHQPASYLELLKIPHIFLNVFTDINIEYGKIAKELFSYADDTDKDFDFWYTSIYKKISDYQTIHSDTLLPRTVPEDFKVSKNFFDQYDLDLPILKQFSDWEKEFQQKLKKDNSSTVSKKNPSHSKPKVKKAPITKVRPLKNQQNELSPSSEIILTESKQLAVETAAKKDGDKAEKFSKATTIKPVAFSAPLPEEEKSIHQSLLETSPFLVHTRITDYFDPNKEVNIRNQESLFIHNFAWAVNEILFKFGLRYPRENEWGVLQPAIAILCQVEHPMYTQSEVFRITATFDHKILEDELLAHNSSKTYHPSNICYHRTLTRRSQQEEVVEEYIENGKNQFVDFPALPSQALQVEIPEELLKNKYPDGSFIESVKGGVVTIRDPKHDLNGKKCRLHLFIIK